MTSSGRFMLAEIIQRKGTIIVRANAPMITVQITRTSICFSR